MHGVSLIRFIVGVVGNIISGLLFIAPVPTFWRICKKKSTEKFHPYPYLAALMNCMLWIFYGLPFIHPDSTLVITINSFGLVMQIIYLSLFFIYTSDNKYRHVIFRYVVAELVVLVIVVVCSLLLLHTTDKRSMVVGILCDIAGIIMYFSPLSILKKVYKTKSAEYMPKLLCFAGAANGVTWFAYAFLKKFDPYIAVGNGIGGLFGIFQLYVIGYYTLKAKMNKDNEAKDGEKPSNVQLSNIV